MSLEMARWAVPGAENFDRYDRAENWGEGAVLRRREAPIAAYFRFYEWNLFGAVREGLHTQADRNQRAEATWDDDGTSAVIEYPDQGVSIALDLVETGVEMTLTVENRTERDWPALAALVPCLSPGRAAGDPEHPVLADPEHERTYFYGRSGLELLVDREIHWHETYHDRVQDRRPDGGFPWAAKWRTDSDVLAEPLMVRESSDGRWTMGIAWEEALSAQGHNPWWCLHLSAAVGPLDAGETRTLDGKLYLLEGGADRVVERYERDFPRK